MADLVFNIGLGIISWFIARKKGFNPWCWVVAMGILGLILVLCLPPANAAGIDPMKLQKRKSLARTVGTSLSALFCVILFAEMLAKLVRQ
jgi:hypothetical protein